MLVNGGGGGGGGRGICVRKRNMAGACGYIIIIMYVMYGIVSVKRNPTYIIYFVVDILAF